ncbi:hypothetical protein MMC11_003432 [Xylographa trunciseda]|nr:hypothetical protein [Xylographa trunciseda]
MEPISSTATVTGLVATIATLATTLTTLRERCNFAPLNITLVANSLWTIKEALEAIAGWRFKAAELSRSSQQLDADLRVSLESCALVVAVLERKLVETDIVRPSVRDKIGIVNLDTIYKDFTHHLAAQIKAFQLLVKIFQCTTLTEQKERLSQHETRSVLQQVQNSAVSLQSEDQDIHDAASILSEDPSVHLAVDDILLNHPLYKKVYKKGGVLLEVESKLSETASRYAPEYYAQVPSLTRAITRKPIGHGKSKSADYVDKRTKAFLVDPFFAQHAALPFLGIPFHGESSSPFLEEKFQAEEEQRNAKSLYELSSEGDIDNNLKPFDQDKNSSCSLNTSTRNDVVATSDSFRNRSTAEGFDKNTAIIAEDDRNIEQTKLSVDPSGVALAKQDSERLTQSSGQTVVDEVVTPLSVNSISCDDPKKFLSAHQLNSKLPSRFAASDDECSTKSQISIAVPTVTLATAYDDDDAVSCQSRHIDWKSQSGNGDDASKVLEIPAGKDLLQSIRCSTSNNRNLETSADSDTFDINFGPDPNLDITITHSSPNIGDLFKTDQSYQERLIAASSQGKSLNGVEKLDWFEGQKFGDSVLQILRPQGVESPQKQTPPIPVVVEPTPLIAGGIHGTNENESLAGSPVVSLLNLRTREIQSVAQDVSTFSIESGEGRPLSPITTIPSQLSSQPQTTSLGTKWPGLLNERIRPELHKLQYEHADAKRIGDTQGAKNAIQKSTTIIQKTYFPELLFPDPSKSIQTTPKASRRLSSVARLSIGPTSQQAEKVQAIHAAAATGDFQQLVNLLEQSPKLADSHAPHIDVRGNTQSRTPLMSAVIGGQIPCMELLGSYNVIVATAGRNGRTALHLAVEAAQLSAVTWLLESGTASTAMRTKNHDTNLVDITDTSGSTALHIAASMGQIEIAEFLLSMGAKIDAIDNGGRTPLHCAVMHSQDIMVAALIARGSDINALDENRTTPLMWATMVNSVKSLFHLSEKGADITRRDMKGESVIHHAARSGNIAVIDMLHTQLEDLEVKNMIGETPLHLACARDQSAVVAALLQAGVQVNRWTSSGRSKSGFLSKAVVMSLLRGTKKVGLLQSSTPLHYTCFLGHYYSAVLLVKHGAWVNAALEDSMTPLMLAVESQNVQLVTFLLDNGAKVNAATARGCLTPLHFACRAGNLEMTQLLVDRGANTMALTASVPPETPASYGAKVGIKSQAAVNYVLSIDSSCAPSNVASSALYG